MDISNACFFTGHRRLKDEGSIKDSVLVLVRKLINEGVTTFYSGAALGFDSLCADIIIELKKEFEHIKLIMYIPCYGSMTSWTFEQQYHARIQRSKADDRIFITEESYNQTVMKKRNYALVDSGMHCICYYNSPRTGTGQTVRYAQKQGRIIYNVAKDGI